MGLPKQGFVNQVYSLHLIYDGVTLGGLAGEGLSMGDVLGTVGFADNLLGRRYGNQPAAVAGAQVGAVVPRPQGAPYQDTGVGGPVTYVVGPPGTVTDTGKAWPVNGLAGRQVTSVSGGAQTTMIVASNTATVLTSTAAGWSAGVPAAGALYVVGPPPANQYSTPGGPARTAADSDNFYQAQMKLGNQENV